MITLTRFRKLIAVCLFAAWASLYSINSADAIEDARRGPGPEYNDQLVAQALATPAEQAVYLSQVGTEPSNDSPVFVDANVAMMTNLLPEAFRASSLVTLPEGPPPRARPRLFQLFSIYRL